MSNTERKISPSLLMAWCKSQQAAWQYLYGPKQETAAMNLGSAVHCAILEPEELHKRYTLKDWDGRTKEGRERAKEVEATGLLALSEAEWEKVQGIYKNAMQNEVIKEIVSGDGCHREVKLETDRFKGIIDLYTDSGYLIDLKTTSDANPYGFSRSYLRMYYHVQMAIYRRLLAATGVEVKRCYVIVAETASPYNVDMYRVPDEWVAKGDEIVDAEVPLLHYAIRENNWMTGYNDTIKSLGDYVSLPN